MLLKNSALLFCVIAGSLATAEEGPIVETKYGKVQGFNYPTKDGSTAEVFLAIPFAQPPVGNLRFEKPEEPKPWNDVYQATQFRNDCTPHYRLVAQFSTYSGEDCLTLNVIKPKIAKKLPVLFWVHGGGYAIGAASHHGYEVFANKYASQDVIVVSIQYRLGFLGFFSDGTANAKGNMGLFDQAAALRFVKENIENFGGDSERITLWGYSAGGSSVSQLTLSPYTRDLYSQAFIMSASSFAGWANGAYVADHSKALAKELGCGEVEDRKSCLKEKPLEEIFDAVEKLGITTGNIDILKWSPVIDGDFLPKHPSELVEESPVKPTIIGLSSKEGAYFTIANMGRVLADFCLDEDLAKKVDEQFVIDTIQNKLLYNNRFGEHNKKVLEKILDHYINQEGVAVAEKSNGYFIDKYTEILSDVTFNVPVVREIKQRVSQKNRKVWAYLFDHYNDAIWKPHVPKEAKGSPHANEYHYLFEMPVLAKINMEEEPDSRVQHDLINIIISFVKNGHPSIMNIDWKPVGDAEKIEYLNYGTEDVSVKTGFFSKAANFWNELSDKEGFDIVDPCDAPDTDINNNDKSEL